MAVNKNKKAIILGRNYCNILTTARALGEAGYDVEVVKVFKTKPSALKFLRTMKPDSYSKYVKSYTEIIVNQNENAIFDYLCSNGDENRKKLLIPVDDYVCHAIDKNLDKLCKFYFAPSINNTAGEIIRLMDKNEQKIKANGYVPMLKSWLIKSENGSFDIPRDICYPCFVKPNVSMLSTKSKMAKCSDQAQLSCVLTKYASQGDFEMLVEEFADIKNEYSIIGLSTENGVHCAGVLKVIEGGNRDRKGVALVGEMMGCKGFEDITKACADYVESLNYNGMFDIDLIETTDDKLYFVEINFRAGASTYALNKAGINLYGLYADSVLNNTPVDINVDIKNVKFVSEKVLMEEYARGDASASKVKSLMKSADVFFVKDENDPKPYKYFKKYYFHSTLLRLIYKLKG